MGVIFNKSNVLINKSNIFVNEFSSLADINIIYNSGTGYTYSTGLIFSENNPTWLSIDGSSDFKLYNAGYIPSSNEGYYYATTYINSGGTYDEQVWTDGSSLMFCSDNTEIPLSDWDVPLLYAIHPHESSIYYRVWDFSAGFLLTSVEKQNGDLYGLFRASDGTITAKYKRGGVWTIMHTFSTTNTSNLYLTAKGFGWSHINNPKTSSNFIQL